MAKNTLKNKLIIIGITAAVAAGGILSYISYNSPESRTKRLYNQVMAKPATLEELESIKKIDKTKLYNTLKSELTNREYQVLDSVLGLEDLSNNDVLFLERCLKANYQAKKLIQERNLN